MGLAMELVLTPLIKELLVKKRALENMAPVDLPI